jgi:hypothetical protein
LESSGAPDMSGGAPDTVRWHTGQSGAPDQNFAPLLNPKLDLFIG